MKKYKVLISNSALLIALILLLSILTKDTATITIIVISVSIALCACTCAMVALSKSNFKGYTNIPTWKHIRNLFIYIASTVLGGILGNLF